MLVEINDEESDVLCEILRKEWPYSIHAIYFVRTCLKWKKKYKELDVTLLRSQNMASGVIIIIYKSGCLYPEVTFYALDSHEEELKQCLLHCPLIDWNNKFRPVQILSKHLPVFHHVMLEKSCKVIFSITLILLHMTPENALKLDTTCPSDVEICKLTPAHLDEMFETWVMKDVYNIDELKISFVCEEEYALGVFSKQSGILLCRNVRSHCGVIAALQTIPEATGKGYAKLLMRNVTKKIAENSEEPYTVIADFNKTSLSVFRSVGYETICDTISYIIGTDDK